MFLITGSPYLLSSVFCISNEVLLLFVLLLMGLLVVTDVVFYRNLCAGVVISCRVQDNELFQEIARKSLVVCYQEQM